MSREVVIQNIVWKKIEKSILFSAISYKIANTPLVGAVIQNVGTIANVKPDKYSAKERQCVELRGLVQRISRIVDLYERIPPKMLHIVPEPLLDDMQNEAIEVGSVFKRIEDFNYNNVINPNQVAKEIIRDLERVYLTSYKQFSPFVAFANDKSAEFYLLQTKAARLLEETRKESESIMAKLGKRDDESERIIKGLRDNSALLAVTKQARAFSIESSSHLCASRVWLVFTVLCAILFISAAFASLFLHQWDKLSADINNPYMAFQIGLSKVLIFTILSYMLYFCTKNTLSHKHNYIINKHRQNALMTFETLANAAKSIENKEIILTHASNCIFSPQPTGYSKEGDSSAPSSKSVVELFAKSFSDQG